MIEFPNIQVPLDAALPENQELLRALAAEKLDIDVEDVVSVRILKKSVDARKKSNVHFVCTLGITLVSESHELNVIYSNSVAEDGQPTAVIGTVRSMVVGPEVHTTNGMRIFQTGEKLTVPVVPPALLKEGVKRPVVVGTGPAGLFAALYLARSGLHPLVVERGAQVDERVAAVDAFNAGADFDPVTNIQFGEGGAGTFSDGKLTTNTKNPLTQVVLDWFVEAGAPEEILIEGKPHIGTDKLRDVVKTLRQQIERCGGEVRFNTQLVDCHFEQGALVGITLENTLTGERQQEPATHVILATGHSARDTFQMVRDAGLAMERKPFSLGVRIEHPQRLIDQAQYGPAAGHPALSAADYKLSTHLKNGRGVYTFCMCPGGQVVAAASEEGGVVVNGMSVHARDGQNANSAVLVSVDPADFPGDDVLAGVEFQRTWERAAYNLVLKNGGKPYQAPAQRVGSFLGQKPQKGKKTTVRPSYPRGVVWADLHECLPAFVGESLEEALPQFDRRIRGFADPQAVMTGVETRSSSPVRILRNDALQAVFPSEEGRPEAQPMPTGLFPCGEGAGFAGGIMSAAVDGLKVAQALVRALCIVDIAALAKSEKRESSVPHMHLGSTPLADGPLETWQDGEGNNYEYRTLGRGGLRVESVTPATDQLCMPAQLGGQLVTELSAQVFLGASQLTHVELPARVTRLPHAVFSPLVNLTSLALPAGALSFDTRDLSYLKQLEILRMPDMLSIIPGNLFSACKAKVLVVGKNTRAVADSAFLGATLERIEVDPENPYFTTDGKGLYRKDDGALAVLAVRVPHYSVRPGCRIIATKAFARNEALETVELPDSLEEIERFAFSQSTLKALQTPASLRIIGEKAFSQCTQLETVRLNQGLRVLGEEAFLRTLIKELELPASLEEVGASFCDEVREVEDHLVPQVSVSAGESQFFMDNGRVLYKRTPQGVVCQVFLDGDARTYALDPNTVGVASQAFSRKTALEEVTVPAGLKRIAALAFRGCARLRSVEGSTALEEVGDSAFAGTCLQQLYLPETFRSMSDSALILKEGSAGTLASVLSNVTVHPDNPVYFVSQGFLCKRTQREGVVAVLYQDNQKSAEVPTEVTYLGSRCFANASNLVSLTLHDGITGFATGSLRCPYAICHVRYRCLNRPFQGRTTLDFFFASEYTGIDRLRAAFERPDTDYDFAYEASDDAMYWSHDVDSAYKFMLDRLEDPFCLKDFNVQRFESYCRGHLAQALNGFADGNYLRGYDQMVNQGFLTEENIAWAVELVTERGNVEATGRLMELRRKHFSRNVMDDYDL